MAKKEVQKKENNKQVKSDGKFYTISKNKDTNLWEIRLAQTKGAVGKVISKCKTKVEAEEYIQNLTAKNGRKAIIHNSKGASKGKATKIK